MKRVFVLFMVSALTVTTVCAQRSAKAGSVFTDDQTSGSFFITPKVGLNIANISKLEGDVRLGMNLGVSGEYMVNSLIGIEGGVFYSMQGTSFKITQGVELDLNNDYINVPIFLKVYVADGFNIFAGPQFGYLISSKMKANTGSNLIDQLVNVIGNSWDFSEYEKKFDFSAVIGIGYQFEMGLSISANYNIGLTKVTDVPTFNLGSFDFDLNPDARNNVIQVNLGYSF